MTIKSISIEYENGTQITLDSDQFARELMGFLESFRGQLIEAATVTWTRCRICNGTGKHARGYCACQMGEDIRRVETGSLSLDAGYDGVQPEAQS